MRLVLATGGARRLAACEWPDWLRYQYELQTPREGIKAEWLRNFFFKTEAPFIGPTVGQDTTLDRFPHFLPGLHIQP